MRRNGPKGWEPDWAEFDTLVGIQCTAPGIRFDVIDLAEPKVFDVTIMPEKR